MRYLSMHLTRIFLADVLDMSIFPYGSASFWKSSSGRINMGCFRDREMPWSKRSFSGGWRDTYLSGHCLDFLIWTRHFRLLYHRKGWHTKLLRGGCLSAFPFFFELFLFFRAETWQNHRMAEVKRHLWRSSRQIPLFRVGSARTGCSGIYLVVFWISPRLEAPQLLSRHAVSVFNHPYGKKNKIK